MQSGVRGVRRSQQLTDDNSPKKMNQSTICEFIEKLGNDRKGVAPLVRFGKELGVSPADVTTLIAKLEACSTVILVKTESGKIQSTRLTSTQDGCYSERLNRGLRFTRYYKGNTLLYEIDDSAVNEAGRHSFELKKQALAEGVPYFTAFGEFKALASFCAAKLAASWAQAPAN